MAGEKGNRPFHEQVLYILLGLVVVVCIGWPTINWIAKQKLVSSNLSDTKAYWPSEFSAIGSAMGVKSGGSSAGVAGVTNFFKDLFSGSGSATTATPGAGGTGYAYGGDFSGTGGYATPIPSQPTPTPEPLNEAAIYEEAVVDWLNGQVESCAQGLIATTNLRRTKLYAWCTAHQNWKQQLAQASSITFLPNTEIISAESAETIRELTEKIIWGDETVPGNARVANVLEGYRRAVEAQQVVVDLEQYVTAVNELKNTTDEERLVQLIGLIKGVGGTFTNMGTEKSTLIKLNVTPFKVRIVAPWKGIAEQEVLLNNGFIKTYNDASNAEGQMNFNGIVAQPTPAVTNRLDTEQPMMPTEPQETVSLYAPSAAPATMPTPMPTEPQPTTASPAQESGGQPSVSDILGTAVVIESCPVRVGTQGGTAGDTTIGQVQPGESVQVHKKDLDGSCAGGSCEWWEVSTQSGVRGYIHSTCVTMQ